MHGHTEIEVEDWFRKAAGGPRVTRAATEALNVIPKYGRLEIRKNFFTVRATNSWNNIPSEIKLSPSTSGFKTGYSKYREMNDN